MGLVVEAVLQGGEALVRLGVAEDGEATMGQVEGYGLPHLGGGPREEDLMGETFGTHHLEGDDGVIIQRYLKLP